MPVRFGISLVPEPSFTAKVYRARQLVCGQYGSWAAEMHMLHLPLVEYFRCTEQCIDAVDGVLETVARETREATPRFNLTHRGVTTYPDRLGDVCLDFSASGVSAPLNALHRRLTDRLGQVPGVTLTSGATQGEFRSRIALMQHADVPAGVLADAVEFARAVVVDLQVPSRTRAWRLLLIRFQSQAAGDDWSDGSWAADLSWRTLSSHEL